MKRVLGQLLALYSRNVQRLSVLPVAPYGHVRVDAIGFDRSVTHGLGRPVVMRPGKPAPGGFEEVQALFRGAGLDLPPIPAKLARHFKRRGDWCFSSRAVTRSPYLIHDYVAELPGRRRGHYVLIAHAGHGANSYALHYYLVQPPLSLFLQLAWGGVYMNETQATPSVNESFRLVGGLLDAVTEAVRRGRLRPHDHLIVVASSFFGGYLSLPEHQKCPAQHADISAPWNKGAPQEFLCQALEWCRAR